MGSGGEDWERIVAFWRVILRVIIAIFAVVLIAVLLSGAVVVADFMHR